jgi:hypothetical protein
LFGAASTKVLKPDFTMLALPPIRPGPLMVKLLFVELLVTIEGDTVRPAGMLIPVITQAVSSKSTLSPEKKAEAQPRRRSGLVI